MEQVILQHYQGFTEVSMDSWQLQKRNVFLRGEINQQAANELISQLIYLKEEDNDRDINLFIDSQGGGVKEGLSVIDAIKMSHLPVNIIVIGEAASMAAVILACGEKGRRYIFPHSRVMIHEPLISGNMYKSASSLQDISKSLLKIKTMINELLASSTGKSLDEINEMVTEHDYWMDAQEAIEFGICDSIYQGFASGSTEMR